MNKLDYQTVAKTHSPVLAEYVLERLTPELKKEFKFKGVDEEVVQKLIDKWLVV